MFIINVQPTVIAPVCNIEHEQTAPGFLISIDKLIRSQSNPYTPYVVLYNFLLYNSMPTIFPFVIRTHLIIDGSIKNIT